MNRRFIIGALLVLLAGIGVLLYLSRDYKFGTIPSPSDQEIAKKYAEINAQLGQPEVQTQAVLAPINLAQPIRLAVGGLGFDDDDSNRKLGDLVTAKLTGAPGFELVERQSLDKILQELSMSWSGFVRAKDIVRAGKLLKVDWFLVGTKAKINDTNSLVVRVVDARTGIMRDAGVFPLAKSSMQLADDLAEFLRQTREDAAQAKMRVYLAVGAFEDLSVNNRQADFPEQIRGYLTAAYRGSSVTLLERDYVETLLQEVHLDMAGLTDNTNAPSAMQSAFWLVSGEYQSYETTNLQVEVKLDVRRIFGKHWTANLRGLPGDSIGKKLKTSIDTVMNQHPEIINPNRATESRIQMSIGKDLYDAGPSGSHWGHNNLDLVWINDNWTEDDRLRAKQKRQVEEVIRAFETVLLLSPTNREAKMYIAACLRKSVISRLDDARNYYREIIYEPVQDNWTGIAEQALPLVMGYSSADERLRWFKSAAAETTNLQAAAYYSKQAEGAASDVTVDAGNSPEADQIAEQRLFTCLQSYKSMLEGKSGSSMPYLGMGDYVKVHGWKPAEAAQKLAELLPKMKQQAPELGPYLVATVLTFQVDTNTPLVPEFQHVLDDFIEHPDNTLNPVGFWDYIRWSVYDWCLEKTNYTLAIHLMKSEQKAAASGRVPDLHFDNQEQIKLGYLYLAVQCWQDALNIFETFNNRPFQATQSGPWGEAFQPVLTDKPADLCRHKLGLAATTDARKFDIGKPVMCLCSPSAFFADDNGLWVGIDGRLLHLNFALQTNLDIALPVNESVPITALCVTPSKIWIGTQGAGLIEYDKQKGQFHHLTQADGLLMDDLASLQVTGDSLWIGYGGATGSGLGRVDLVSQKVTSFMASLDDTQSSHTSDPPPHEPIGNIVADGNGDIDVSVAGGIHRLNVSRGDWATLPTKSGAWATCFAETAQYLAEGGGTSMTEVELETKSGGSAATGQIIKSNLVISVPDLWKMEASFKTNGHHQRVSTYNLAQLRPKGGIAFQNLQDHRWQYLEDADAIPNPPSTMTLAGNNLWVGGEGAIALVDLKTSKVRKFCHIKATGVDRIQIAGGYVWAQFDWHLYRFPLAQLE